MANEIQLAYTKGLTNTLYATLHNVAGNVWVTGGNTFEAFAAASLATYKITLTENGVNSGVYVGSLPAGLTTSGKYTAKAWTATDTYIGADNLYWSDTAEITKTEYDMRFGSTNTEPDGVATNMWDKMAQLWMRFFNKVDKNDTAKTIQVYNTSDVAETTQTYSEGTTDIVEKATSV